MCYLSTYELDLIISWICWHFYNKCISIPDDPLKGSKRPRFPTQFTLCEYWNIVTIVKQCSKMLLLLTFSYFRATGDTKETLPVLIAHRLYFGWPPGLNQLSSSGSWEGSIPGDIRWEAGCILERSIIALTLSNRQPFRLTVTPMTNLELPINLTCVPLHGGRKPEYPEGIHTAKGRTCIQAPTSQWTHVPWKDFNATALDCSSQWYSFCSGDLLQDAGWL